MRSYRGANPFPARVHEHSHRPYLRRRAAPSRCVGNPADRRRHPDPAHPRDRSHHSDPLRRHGYGDRGRHGDRDGAARRHRRAPPQSRCRGTGGSGPCGQALRKRHGGQSDHPVAQPDPGGRPCVDGAPQDLRLPGGRSRRQAGRHPHPSRHALRREPQAARRRADDEPEPRHGESRRQHRGGTAPAPSAADREIAGGGRGLSLRRPDHRQGYRESGHLSRRHQGRHRPAARRRRHHDRRQGLRPHGGAGRCRVRSDRDRYRPRP